MFKSLSIRLHKRNICVCLIQRYSLTGENSEVRTKLSVRDVGSNPATPFWIFKKKGCTKVENVLNVHERKMDKSSESLSIDKIKKAAEHLRQALILMCQIDGCDDASDQMKKKIRSIVSAFSIDKSELERMIESYEKE